MLKRVHDECRALPAFRYGYIALSLPQVDNFCVGRPFTAANAGKQVNKIHAANPCQNGLVDPFTVGITLNQSNRPKESPCN